MELGTQDWVDSLFLRYGIKPPDFLDHCGGCGMAFDIFHAFDCNKGGLITECHNKLRYGVADLASKAFPPRTCVMTHKHTQVAPCMEGMKNSKVPLQRKRGV